MNINNVILKAVAVKKEQYPDESYPEIAFVGRSNVGKSSLLNTMFNRKALAKTSSSPGKTRTINFYLVEDKVYFVDLPGYGYAKAPKIEIKKWGKMIEFYLTKRNTLKAIVLLIDIRHKPSEDDKLMYEWLKYYNYKIIIVATKLDKIKKNQLNKHLNIIKDFLNLAKEEVIIPFSSLTKKGREDLWVILNKMLTN